MHTIMKRLGVLCAGSLLLACASATGEHSLLEAAPAPLAAAPDRANEAYLLGRTAHMSKRFDVAIVYYQQALAMDPRHVNARNGLATLYAEQGEFARAITLWRALTDDSAAAAGPHSAFLFSNLGYAQFLNGDYEQALGALERACVLDPLNYRAWQHLGSALDKLGQHDRAQLMLRQAATLQQHDFKTDYVAASGSGVAAITKAVLAPERPGQQWAETRIHTSADGMLELRRVEAHGTVPVSTAPVSAPSMSRWAMDPRLRGDDALTERHSTLDPQPAGAAARLDAGALLEIRNGNGVTGMARALARQMGGTLQVVRLSNQKGFGVQHTRVEYQPEFRDAAERLAARFGDATVVPVSHVGRADVRLVIGHDLAGHKPRSARLASAAQDADTSAVSAQAPQG